MFLSSEYLILAMLTYLLSNFDFIDVYDINLVKNDNFKCKLNMVGLNSIWGEIINYDEKKSLPNSI